MRKIVMSFALIAAGILSSNGVYSLENKMETNLENKMEMEMGSGLENEMESGLGLRQERCPSNGRGSCSRFCRSIRMRFQSFYCDTRRATCICRR